MYESSVYRCNPVCKNALILDSFFSSIRKNGFGPRETHVALGNFYSLKEYLVLWVAPDVFGCLWLSLGVFGSLWKSLEVFGCL